MGLPRAHNGAAGEARPLGEHVDPGGGVFAPERDPAFALQKGEPEKEGDADVRVGERLPRRMVA